jgi:hypothetical protein
MQEAIHWLNDALDTKDLVIGMTYYLVKDGSIKATNGRLTASYPWPHDGEFLVPGKEFEKVLARMDEEPKIIVEDKKIKIRTEAFRSSIQTRPATDWDYPGIEKAQWELIPDDLIEALRKLRPFLSENATQAWAQCVALEPGWAYASNNIAIAGVQCTSLKNIQALLPIWAIDFVLSRTANLSHWAWSDHYVAFGWNSGAWMRSQLTVGKFPEKAATMIRQSIHENPTQPVTDEFRKAFQQVAELAEDTLLIFRNRIESKFGQALVFSIADCAIPQGSIASAWGAKFLLPVLKVADYWAPDAWPKPAPFKGQNVSGYVVGRRM